MSDTPRHSVSVAAVIFDDSGENVLLIQRRDNAKWEPPGGVLELDETIEDGLRREVREETGAEIAIGPLTGIYKNLPRGIVALVFRALLRTEPVEATSEASSVAWIPLAHVEGLMAEAYHKRILDAGSPPREAVPIRAHDGNNLLSNTRSNDSQPRK